MSFHWAPGPEDTAHLWGAHHEYDLIDDDDLAKSPTWPTYEKCPRTGTKSYPNAEEAAEHAGRIHTWCEKAGRDYLPMVPRRCVFDGQDHWHLRRV
jgi:hypothetical protein